MKTGRPVFFFSGKSMILRKYTFFEKTNQRIYYIEKKLLSVFPKIFLEVGFNIFLLILEGISNSLLDFSKPK